MTPPPLPFYHHHYHQQSTMFALKCLLIANAIIRQVLNLTWNLMTVGTLAAHYNKYKKCSKSHKLPPVTTGVRGLRVD